MAIGVYIQNRLTMSGKMLAAARTHKKKLAQKLADLSESAGKPVSGEIWLSVLDALDAMLKQRVDELQKGEQSLSSEKADRAWSSAYLITARSYVNMCSASSF